MTKSIEQQVISALKRGLPLIYKPNVRGRKFAYLDQKNKIAYASPTENGIGSHASIDWRHSANNGFIRINNYARQKILAKTKNSDYLVILDCGDDLIENILPKWIMQPKLTIRLLDKQPIALLLAISTDMSQCLEIHACLPIYQNSSIAPANKLEADITAKQMRYIWKQCGGGAISYKFGYQDSHNVPGEIDGRTSQRDIIITKEGTFSWTENAFSLINDDLMRWVDAHLKVIAAPDFKIKAIIESKNQQKFWNLLAKCLVPDNITLKSRRLNSINDILSNVIVSRIPLVESQAGLVNQMTNDTIHWADIACPINSKMRQVREDFANSLAWQFPAVENYVYQGLQEGKVYYADYDVTGFFDTMIHEVYVELDVQYKLPKRKTKQIADWNFPAKKNIQSAKFADVNPVPEKSLPEIFNIIDRCNPRQKIFTVNNAIIALTGQSKISRVAIKKINKTAVCKSKPNLL